MTTADHARLELLNSASAELDHPGDARERLARALALMLGESHPLLALEIHDLKGGRTLLAACVDTEIAHELARRGPSIDPNGEALRNGKSAVRQVSDELLASLARDREELELLRRLSLGELLLVPLRAKQRSLGMLAACSVRGKSFDPSDRLLFELFARHLIAYIDSELFVLDAGEQQRRAELEALLVGVVSHDLRNPLGVVTLAGSLLLSGELTATQRRVVERLMSAGRQSARLVADLLDFTVARRDGIRLVRASGDLHAIVAHALEDLRAIWPGRIVEHAHEGDGTSYLDEGRIQQIVMNLVGNALQHSPAASRVQVETRGEPGAVVFSVANQGRPIPPSLMQQLFAPLRRGEDAGQRHGSLGLGLFIVHHLVLAHGGTVEVISNEREGTRFTIRLPVSTPPLAIPALGSAAVSEAN